jgi:hypothetical protein
MEWDNVAAIPISTFEHWWNLQIPKSTRKHIRRAERAGVVVRKVRFSDDLVRGIQRIYNETPVRQGRKFSHYCEDFNSLKQSHGTFDGMRDYIAAFLSDELIGFISLIYTAKTARSVQVITKISHQDKWPTNALLAKAVEVCAEKELQYLVYGRFDYGKVGTKGLVSFKMENGFQKILIPRYFVPLNLKGRIALKLKLHRPVSEYLPSVAIKALMNLRHRYYLHRYSLPGKVRTNAMQDAGQC